MTISNFSCFCSLSLVAFLETGSLSFGGVDLMSYRNEWDHISFPKMGKVSFGDCESFLHLVLMIYSILGFT